MLVSFWPDCFQISIRTYVIVWSFGFHFDLVIFQLNQSGLRLASINIKVFIFCLDLNCLRRCFECLHETDILFVFIFYSQQFFVSCFEFMSLVLHFTNFELVVVVDLGPLIP